MANQPINTAPVENFIKKVKTADSSRSLEIRMSINEAKVLAFTLGIMSTRLHGDLEKLIVNLNKEEEIIQVNMDGGKNW